MFFLAVNCCYCGAMRREAAAMRARRFLLCGFTALILKFLTVEAHDVIVAMVPQVKALLLMPTGFVEPIEHRHDLLKIVGI